MGDVVIHTSTLHHVAQRLREDKVHLAARFLDRVHELVTVSGLSVFPSKKLSDHIPELLAEIAAYLEAAAVPTDQATEALTSRAREVGELRHTQQVPVYQLLQEYRILAELLEDSFARYVNELHAPEPMAIIRAARRMNEALRLLEEHSVHTFVENYAQTLERQSMQLRKFSRLVSHEIRQPLAVLQVISRALPVGSGDVGSVRMMDIFERSVHRLAEVTGKLERLARITPGTDLVLSERSVDLTEVAHEAAAQLSDAARQSGVEIRVDAGLPVLRLDPARAELIFLNLMANAIKFSDPAKPTRYVEVAHGGGEESSIVIRDNGVGMTPALLQTVFREFVRAHSQRDEDIRPGGLRLGLSIVRECMDHSNGSVRVDSIEGRGTTFKLTWPAAARPAR
jgi:signal transduction histidine kinase